MIDYGFRRCSRRDHSAFAYISAVVVALAFVTRGTFFVPLLVRTDQSSVALPLGVAAFETRYSQGTARVLAFSAPFILPTLPVSRRRGAPHHRRISAPSTARRSVNHPLGRFL